jgi:hypothetical protein
MICPAPPLLRLNVPPLEALALVLPGVKMTLPPSEPAASRVSVVWPTLSINAPPVYPSPTVRLIAPLLPVDVFEPSVVDSMTLPPTKLAPVVLPVAM